MARARAQRAVSSGGRPCASASSSRASRRCVHASCACRSHRSCRSRCGSVGTAPRTAPPRGAVSSIGSQRSDAGARFPRVSTTGPVSSGETKASQHRPSRRASSRRLPRPPCEGRHAGRIGLHRCRGIPFTIIQNTKIDICPRRRHAVFVRHADGQAAHISIAGRFVAIDHIALAADDLRHPAPARRSSGCAPERRVRPRC